MLAALTSLFTAPGALTLITTPPFPAASQNTPRMLRGARVIFLLLKQFSSELATEVEVFLTLPIKLVGGEAETGETRPGWMRVLAVEIMRGCVFLFLSLSLTLRRLCVHASRMQALRGRRVHA